ncbi:MAG: hypothetical protein JWP75_3867 [Frondihabitans sp.]|nr:hypothetical protein [Frondihabitans sp.]
MRAGVVALAATPQPSRCVQHGGQIASSCVVFGCVETFARRENDGGNSALGRSAG